MTNIVTQSKDNTCVACVLAMMVDETEQYVLDWFDHKDPPFCDEDVFIFLAHHGIFSYFGVDFGDNGAKINRFDKITADMDLRKNYAYMVVESPTKNGKTHAVFWDRKNVLDPLKKTKQCLSNYRVITIYPMMVTSKRHETY